MKDLTGMRFGKLTAIRIFEHGAYKKENKWLCKCDCGNEKILSTGMLTHGYVTDCGCVYRSKINNQMVGKKFGMLTVIKDSGMRTKDGRILWECKCDCGNTAFVSGGNLKAKKRKTVSCGCKRKAQNITHGYTILDKRMYKVYKGMIDRCYNPKNISYKYYGGRGICVCSEWRNDFIKFRSWSLSNGYEESLTIDRTNNEKGYCPENCRWIPAGKQSSNRRCCVYLEYNGETHCIAEWSRITGISDSTISARIKKGWSAEKTLCAPTK